ncbi:hypothetical protein Ahy_A07g033021 [Arachis hypogaea]|uniref:Aminotransferase-like plant mobile domain-containing protein n=1 Tax=Arachis hypogaea TaxID=3818 RepID=A0A445C856_ARAHY|nr:hypothetical protein Ahy_A07g033021 [Arachis hypogaea]
MGKENEPVTDDEHVAFLSYWLNAIIYCSRSVQLQKLFLPLAALLYEKNNFNLANSLITKSCFDWWTTYFSKYDRALEEIKNSAIQTTLAAEDSPRRTLKRKVETPAPSIQPQKKIRQALARASRKVQSSNKSSSEESKPRVQNLLAASSDSDDDSETESPPLNQLLLPLPPSRSTHQNQPETEQQESHSPAQTVISAEPIQVIPPVSIGTQVVDMTQEQPSPLQTQNIDNSLIAPDSDSPTHVPETILSPKKSLSSDKNTEPLTPCGSEPPSEIPNMPFDTDLVGLVAFLN